nr:hypothetical protein [Mucilaginibacter humi]
MHGLADHRIAAPEQTIAMINMQLKFRDIDRQVITAELDWQPAAALYIHDQLTDPLLNRYIQFRQGFFIYYTINLQPMPLLKLRNCFFKPSS